MWQMKIMQMLLVCHCLYLSMCIYDVIKTLNLHMYCSDVVQSIAADGIKTKSRILLSWMHACASVYACVVLMRDKNFFTWCVCVCVCGRIFQRIWFEFFTWFKFAYSRKTYHVNSRSCDPTPLFYHILIIFCHSSSTFSGCDTVVTFLFLCY